VIFLCGQKMAQQSVQPLLMNFALSRTEGPEIPGHYDSIRQVWVVDTPDGTVPIIQCKGDQGFATDLVTKTNTVRERDDPNACSLVELTTKTALQAERDDTDPRFAFLELITVTKIGSERPDI
jgi:hypothetical protein